MSEEIKEISHDARLYSQGDPVVRGPLCVPVPLGYPSHHADQVPPKNIKETREDGAVCVPVIENVSLVSFKSLVHPALQ